VLVIDAENGEAEIHRRVRGLGVKPGTLVYVEAERFDLRADLRDVEALLAHYRPDALMLDSLRSLAPGWTRTTPAPSRRPLGRCAASRGATTSRRSSCTMRARRATVIAARPRSARPSISASRSLARVTTRTAAR
jgi:hypothetical protein